MITLSKEQILQRALRQSRISFIKSAKVAEEVKARVEAALPKHMPGSVVAGESARYSGTWQVVVYYQALAEVSYVDAQINQVTRIQIAEALKKAFRPNDLVTSYTRPARRPR